jgi:hypothetical protein
MTSSVNGALRASDHWNRRRHADEDYSIQLTACPDRRNGWVVNLVLYQGRSARTWIGDSTPLAGNVNPLRTHSS